LIEYVGLFHMDWLDMACGMRSALVILHKCVSILIMHGTLKIDNLRRMEYDGNFDLKVHQHLGKDFFKKEFMFLKGFGSKKL